LGIRQNLLAEERRFAVKRKRLSVLQIVAVLKQAEVGCRGGVDPASGDHGANPVSVEEKVQGLETDQVRQCKQLQEVMGG
jgi:hypothetical protein